MIDFALTLLVAVLMVMGVALTAMILINIFIRGIIGTIDAYYDLRETIEFRRKKANEND